MHFEQRPRFWQQNKWVAKREQGGFIREITRTFYSLHRSLLGT
ncbi:hypothetical protein KP78_15880 [Jeotgalibacillus soli]|uniref:Uncharacterized protein n=1 Tax=Jeotgalibacillus soli TaxID=889306 RepID=A0A0C2VUN8_9BACL|nr:hypothetical protein KP78_15880 [Jeotgalibacillus soli]